MAKQFRDFESAREFARALNLKRQKDWLEYCKSGNKPDDIPSNVHHVFKNKGWKGFKDFLGNEIKRKNFKEAREFVRSLNLKGQKEWNEYCKSGNKPDDIPAYPQRIYKKEWIGTGDWLGTGRVHNKDKVFRSYKEAREFVRSLEFKGVREWEEYCKSGNKPDDIAAQPSSTYKNKGWVSWGDFFGTKINLKKFRSFESAREFVRSLEFKNRDEWFEYCKSGNKPEDIPQKPERTYKNKGWIGVGDWLGTGTVANFNKQYRPFKEAKDFVRKLNLKNQQDWLEYCKSGNKPDDIPSNPQKVYKEWNIQRRAGKK
jgi:hypothetical protein